jgi:RNA-binding protein NOB1
MEQPATESPETAQPEAPHPAPAIPENTNSTKTVSSPASSPQTTTPPKPVHSLVIDANAIIKNDPTVSTLLAQAEELYTIPAVISESMSTPVSCG